MQKTKKIPTKKADSLGAVMKPAVFGKPKGFGQPNEKAEQRGEQVEVPQHPTRNLTQHKV